ncbi:D-ribose pyranase [Paludibacterium yongneupense]|uniref:D-ribose pyranase n=1 Tax=Paludibacterium yongneupense TaxID=400061 RepID=UPI0004141740|nr:D-ribose pyranase [Paludibacterium yongneupense]
MKKTQLLNSALSELIATMGHGDMLVIGDAGLPVPPGTLRIDLAVSRGVPSFASVLDAVLSELQVETALLAGELSEVNAGLFAEMADKVAPARVETVTHEAFKALSAKARAVVRTGEFTPYCNIILRAGVVF